nr:hypothetical protein [Tanacetum cinerariifolium]
LGFDQPQPPQSPVIHQPPQELSIQEIEDLKQQYLDELKRLSNLEYRDEIKIAELTENFNGISIEIRKKEKLLQMEQWVNLSTHPSKRFNSFCYDDDEEEDYTIEITPNEPVLSTEEPDNSLSIGDEHLDTIPATESDEVIKSSVENLISIPSERKTRKRQNRIKTGQKREAWRSPEKSKANHSRESKEKRKKYKFKGPKDANSYKLYT